MRIRNSTLVTFLLTWTCSLTWAQDTSVPQVIEVRPELSDIQLAGPGARWSILISAKRADGLEADLTREATFKVAASEGEPAIAVSPNGVVRALRDGGRAGRC